MSGVVEYPWEAIALALAEAPTLCAGNPFGDCSWYHASWPVLKGLGVFISLKSDDDFLPPWPVCRFAPYRPTCSVIENRERLTI